MIQNLEAKIKYSEALSISMRSHIEVLREIRETLPKSFTPGILVDQLIYRIGCYANGIDKQVQRAKQILEAKGGEK